MGSFDEKNRRKKLMTKSLQPIFDESFCHVVTRKLPIRVPLKLRGDMFIK
jgi:hypothetical protein